jgi:hypothetical protein
MGKKKLLAPVSGNSDNFSRLMDRGMAVIISFVSSFMLTLIISQPSRVEISVIVVVLLVLWIMLDRVLRTWFQTSVIMAENRRWRDVIIEVLDFLLLLGIFLVAQLFLLGLRSAIGTSQLSGVEVVSFVLSTMLAGFAIVHRIKALKAPL